MAMAVPYQLFVNDERTVLVRLWSDGSCEVAQRPDSGATWGPPVYLRDVTPQEVTPHG